MTTLPTLDQLIDGGLRGQRVLVRVDFNVPLEGSRVRDDSRLREALPTIEELLAAGARLLLLSHFGRPKGKRVAELSLAPVALRLSDLLGQKVSFAEDCVGEAAETAAEALGDGEACLLENLRFHPGETEADDDFADALAGLGNVYVNDAFGTAHRAHASVVGLPARIERKAAGRLLLRELLALGRLLGDVESPFVAVVGGAKIGGKIDALGNLLPHLDSLLVGGGMANTFLAATGAAIGRSLAEADRFPMAGEILRAAEARAVEVRLPRDLVVAAGIEEPGEIETVPADGIPGDRMALDIGPETRSDFTEAIAGAGTVFWNGPMGVFETAPFDAGTTAVAEAVASCGGFTVVGGGDTVAAVRQAGVAEEIDHVSTGGGASLDLLAGRRLPGVDALGGAT